MSNPLLEAKAKHYLKRLCKNITDRRVGSQGNQAATDFFGETISFFNFSVETPSFECMDWEEQGANLVVNGENYQVFPSPYSLGGKFTAPLLTLSTVEELAATKAADSIFLLRGELTKEQLMPKNFPFYNSEHHQRIIQLLETKNPQAIITATARDLEMVGAAYPFPMFEDGDFDIPSVYLTDVDGEKLAKHSGEEITLESETTRIPSAGKNVIARKGEGHSDRIVFTAHIDTRMGTPGASDNASGIVVLLLLAELLEDYSGGLGIEITAMNGEDYYSNAGEQLYIEQNKDRFGEILLAVNIDDVGYSKGRTAYTLYGVPDGLIEAVSKVFTNQDELVEGEAWYAGDHSLFIHNQVPALALTSEKMSELMQNITHTADDVPEILDRVKLVRVAFVLRDLVHELEKKYTN